MRSSSKRIFVRITTLYQLFLPLKIAVRMRRIRRKREKKSHLFGFVQMISVCQLMLEIFLI